MQKCRTELLLIYVYLEIEYSYTKCIRIFNIPLKTEVDDT